MVNIQKKDRDKIIEGKQSKMALEGQNSEGIKHEGVEEERDL